MAETLLGLVADLLRRPWSAISAAHYLDEYVAAERWTPGAIAELTRARLRRLVWHCVLHVPWWRARMPIAPAEIERLDGTAALPVVAPDERRAAPRAFVAEGGVRVGELRRTAGTRGAPQPVVIDVETAERHKALRRRAELWAGARDGRVVAVWGRDALHEPRALDATELDALDVALGGGRRGGLAVSGPGPSLGALAGAIAAPRGAVDVVIARGPDPAHGGERLAARVGAALVRWYGAAEFGVVAAGCSASPGGALHVHADQFLVEIVDDAGAPLAPGLAGRVVITDLTNLAAPYLRHDTGDRGRLVAAPCTCGRSLARFELA
jgi:phenylacetate-coenzyme A ligase PaaK-like adenylate-forming protein